MLILYVYMIQLFKKMFCIWIKNNSNNLILSKAMAEVSCRFCVSLFFSVSFSKSVILLVISRCSSLMLNQHLINHLIISLTLTLLQCYFNTI